MIRLKKNELINICSPSISLRTIFIIIKNFYGTKKVIYFNTFSYEIKLFSKFFGDNTVIKLIYTLTGLTLKKNVDNNIVNKDIIFDIDWQGTKQLSKFKNLNLIKIYLITSNKQELKNLLATEKKLKDDVRLTKENRELLQSQLEPLNIKNQT